MTLYSTGCPKCKVLKTKLAQKGVDYKLVEDEDDVYRFCNNNHIMELPIFVKDDGSILNFSEANRFINSL